MTDNLSANIPPKDFYPKLDAFIKQNELENKVLVEVERVLFGYDVNLAKLKASIAQIHINLEMLLNETIKKYKPGRKELSCFYLDGIRFSDKIKLFNKTPACNEDVSKKLKEINRLRNDLLHFNIKKPVYFGKDILHDKTVIKDAMIDFSDISRHILTFVAPQGMRQARIRALENPEVAFNKWKKTMATNKQGL